MILLTTATEITSWVVLTVFIAISIFYVYTVWKKDPDKAEKELQEFLDSIQGIMKEHIIVAIETFDFANAKESLIELQEVFFNNVLDDIFDLCVKELDELEKNENTKVLYSLIRKVLTKEKIREYVLVVFSQDEIQDKLTDMYNIALKDKMEAVESEEKELEEEYAPYEEEDYKDPEDTEHVADLDPTVDVTVPNNDPIVPPVEEESDVVSADDPTVEIIETEELPL